jgi:hypothetical protein
MKERLAYWPDLTWISDWRKWEYTSRFKCKWANYERNNTFTILRILFLTNVCQINNPVLFHGQSLHQLYLVIHNLETIDSLHGILSDEVRELVKVGNYLLKI